MKTNIICLLLVAVLVALAGCDNVIREDLLGVSDSELHGIKEGDIEVVQVTTTHSPSRVGIKQEVLYGTNIQIPAKGISLWDLDQIYKERFGPDSARGQSAGGPELITDYEFYVSESGTKPLRFVYYKYIASAKRSSPYDYRTYVLDDVIALTYFYFHAAESKIEDVVAQYIYPLPKEHLSQGVDIRWDLWNDEWGKESPGWQRHPDPRIPQVNNWGGAKIPPSYVQGIEVFKSLSGTKPTMLRLQVVGELYSIDSANSRFEYWTTENQMVFRLYYIEFGGPPEFVKGPKEFVKEWQFPVPPHDPHLGIVVGIDFIEI